MQAWMHITHSLPKIQAKHAAQRMDLIHIFQNLMKAVRLQKEMGMLIDFKSSNMIKRLEKYMRIVSAQNIKHAENILTRHIRGNTAILNFSKIKNHIRFLIAHYFINYWENYLFSPSYSQLYQIDPLNIKSILKIEGNLFVQNSICCQFVYRNR